tara:strand:+ start:799 stop:1275 length:477 start_codon:yes stop_codon:yes gene_type:complete
VRYDYKCNTCGYSFEEHRRVDDRLDVAKCGNCDGVAEFTFPLTGFHLWADIPDYHDEGLGVDITGGRKEKKAILKSMGLVEAGDKQGGARNYDPKANNITANVPVQGRSFDDARREKDAARDSFVVSTGTGSGSERKTASSLENATTARKVHGKAKPF